MADLASGLRAAPCVAPSTPALADRLLAAGWVARLPASRALRVTNEGRRALSRELDVRIV